MTSQLQNRESLDEDRFEEIYEGRPPWDIGRPQKAFVEVADRITGRILDAGCGTGENALFFAERSHDVTGIDFLDRPIRIAKQKAQDRSLTVEFLMADALELAACSLMFDNAIDCGLFHVFSDEDRAVYVAGLGSVLREDGRLFLLCFSDEEPGTAGPRRIAQADLQASFSNGWSIESIQAARFEVVPDLEDFDFSEGGPRAWFAVIRRTT